MRRNGAAQIAAVTALALLTVAPLAHAERKGTAKERAQIASVVALPAKCAKVRVSTLSRKPKWGSVQFRLNGSTCKTFASDGVTIVHKEGGRWKFVTAGSSFTCGELYNRMPRPVAEDLRIDCVSGSPAG